MEDKNNLSKEEEMTKGNNEEQLELDSVWKMKLGYSKEVFMRDALISLARSGMRPDLFFNDFEIIEEQDEFLAASVDIDVKYSFKNGTIHIVNTSHYDNTTETIIDWNLVHYENKKMVQIAVNQNWDGESTELKDKYGNNQHFNRGLEEVKITSNYKEAMQKAKDDGFSIENMIGEYEEMPIDAFVLNKDGIERLISTSMRIACTEWGLAEYKKNLKYNGNYEMKNAIGIIVPRYKLLYHFNDNTYSVISGTGSKKYDGVSCATLEISPPGEPSDFFASDSYNEYKKFIDEKMKEVQVETPARYQKSFIEKIKDKIKTALFGKKEEETQKIWAKVKCSTKNGMQEKEITYVLTDNPSKHLVSTSNRNSAIIVAVDLALKRYNLSPLTEDDIYNIKGLRS